MNNPSAAATAAAPVLFVGVDWADQKHDVSWSAADGSGGRRVIEQSPEQIEAFVAWLIEMAGGGTAALALEKSRGPLQYALMFREGLTLYPIDPQQVARYRQSFTSGGGKSDVGDADLLLRFLRERIADLRPLQPDDEATRRLAHLCQSRRRLVDDATALKLQLLALLKTYFPLLLALGDVTSAVVRKVLRQWPDPREFRRLHPRTLTRLLEEHGRRNEEEVQQLIARIRSCPLASRDKPLLESLSLRAAAVAAQWEALLEGIAKLERAIDKAMAAHPDAALFQGVPGAGRALAPRLLAAFGSDRERYANADEVAVLTGIAPVTKQSGKTKIVVRRRACSRYLKQTFHEFADHARKWCPWSKAYYLWLRSKQMGHHAAVRKLASRWIRILFSVWKTRTPYDPDRYLERLRATHHPLLPYLPTPTPTT